MKKAIKIILLVFVVAWAVFVTVGSIALYGELTSEQEALRAQYNELKAEYDALKSEGRSVTELRGLAYELLFDNVYYEMIVYEEYDLNAEIEKRVEQYELSDSEKYELLMFLQVLIDRYELA